MLDGSYGNYGTALLARRIRCIALKVTIRSTDGVGRFKRFARPE